MPNKDLSKMDINDTNLSLHLENMIQHLKEEEIQSRISGDLEKQSCLDYIFENNVLGELVKYAQDDSDFRILAILLDYVNIPGQTGRVSREALFFLISLGKNNKYFLDFLDGGVKFYEKMDLRLKFSFSLLPKSSTIANGIGGSDAYNKRCNDNLPSSKIDRLEIIIEEFFDLWSFINNVVGIECETITSRLLDTLSNGFFKYVLIPGLLNPFDDQATAATNYATKMIRLTKVQSILDCILSTIFGADLNPEVTFEEPHSPEKTTHVESLREILIERAGSSEDILSLETLRLFDSIIESFNQFGLHNLVFRNLIDLKFIATRDDENAMTKKKFSSRIQRNPKAFVKHLLTIMPQEDRTQNVRSSKAVVVESVDKLNGKSGFNYEDYFLDAQRQVQMATVVYNNWSQSSFCKSTMGFRNGRQDSSLDVETKIRDKFFEGTFMVMILEQLENFLETPLERNLVITSILNRLACIPDERIDWLLYGETDEHRAVDDTDSRGGKRKNLVGILKKLALEAEKSSGKVPNFRTRMQLVKRRGMNNSGKSFRRGSSVDLDSSPTTPVSPASFNSLNTSPTSAQCRDNTTNPFAKFTNFVNAFIVLQEFCKELAAIVFVKYMDIDKAISIAEEEGNDEAERTPETHSQKSYSKYKHEKQRSMSYLGNLGRRYDNKGALYVNKSSDSVKDDIFLTRNSEKFARLMASVEKKQNFNNN
ncbi:12421_t:CDS:2 [Acaulospora colombiana]|uniref:12421_t:CDS:1 n=1 Tax=Acaulospora colombiana TaxID=27376 RepID=A0ACA9L7R8_9GLOM|nr:12421_t:CDS:2 [Acaulospora colombiana]